MKKFIWVLAVAVVVIATWVTFSKISQSRRNAHYKMVLASYSRDLQAGMTRWDVLDYLDKHKVEYHVTGMPPTYNDTYLVNIGEDPARFPENLVCEPWNVYVAMEFDKAGKLTEVHIRKIGTCL